jgi:transposase
MGEDFIGSQGPQLTVVLSRRRRRRRRRRRSSSSSSRNRRRRRRRRRRRQPMSQFHLQLLTFILEIRKVKIKYSVLEIQIAEICETLQSTQIFLGRSDRSSSYSPSSLSFH